MFMKSLKSAARIAAFLPAFALAAVLGTALSILPMSAAFAQSSEAKAMVDAAKAKGIVGEQGDGYIGFVTAADPALQAAVGQINAGRMGVYQNTAASTGVTTEAAGEATAQMLFQRMPPGQYYKPLGGGWIQKQ